MPSKIKSRPADAGAEPTTPTAAAFEVDAVELVKVLNNCLLSASKDAARPVLHAVLLKWEPGTLTGISTDSYRLGIDTATLDYHPNLSAGQFLLDRADASAILKMIQTAQRANKAYSPRPATVRYRPAEPIEVEYGGQVFTSREVEGEFPNWERLMPEENKGKIEPTTHVAFNPVFLADYAKLFPKDSGQTPIRLDLNGPTRPATITRGTYKGLLMPVRLDR